MRSIAEVLRVAIDKSPESELAKERERKKHQRELDGLGREFQQVGLSWRESLVNDPNNTSMVRQQWKGLLAEFANTNKNERLSLLYRFSVGLGLSEEKPEALSAFSGYPLEAYQQTTDGRRFRPASMLLIEVVSDISGLREKQSNEFRHSMKNRQYASEFVGMKETFPGIAHWMVRNSVNSPQSSRLS